MASLLSLTILGRFPSLNEYVCAERRNRYAGASIKRKETERVKRAARTLPHVDAPVRVAFLWVEPNKRRDVDNVAFAKKFILDGLVAAGVLDDDDPAHVRGFSDTFDYDKDAPRVEVTIYEAE